jgi:hypothetical protein
MPDGRFGARLLRLNAEAEHDAPLAAFGKAPEQWVANPAATPTDPHCSSCWKIYAPRKSMVSVVY